MHKYLPPIVCEGFSSHKCAEGQSPGSECTTCQGRKEAIRKMRIICNLSKQSICNKKPHLKKREERASMVEMYPTPMSLMCTHLDLGNVKVVQCDFFNDFMTMILMTRTTNLSRVSSSRCVRSQAMYSRAASVILGHQDTSRLTFVYILYLNTHCLNQKRSSGIVFCIFIQRTNQLSEVLCDQLDAVVSDLRTAGQGEDGQVREGVD